MHDPDLREPEPIHTPTQLWQPWTLIVPAILLLPLLSLAYSLQLSPDGEELRQPYHRARVEESTPEPTPEPTPEATPDATPLKVEPAKAQKFTMFVPDEEGLLHAKTFLTTGGNGAPDFVEAGTNSLKNLFPAAPAVFPAGTQLLGLEQDASDSSLARVSLNDKFWQSGFWAGEMRADAAMQAIAHTLQAAYKQTGGDGPLHVQLLNDGHTKTLLGSFEVDKPYTPDPTLLAEHSSAASVTKP